MNKSELLEAMVHEYGTGIGKKKTEAVINAITGIVATKLRNGEKVTITGFGTFEIVNRAARTGRNPQTGATIKIKASKTPKFKAGKALKDIVNN